MENLTLKKSDFNGELYTTTINGDLWVSNGHWCIHSCLVKSVMGIPIASLPSVIATLPVENPRIDKLTVRQIPAVLGQSHYDRAFGVGTVLFVNSGIIIDGSYVFISSLGALALISTGDAKKLDISDRSSEITGNSGLSPFGAPGNLAFTTSMDRNKFHLSPYAPALGSILAAINQKEVQK